MSKCGYKYCPFISGTCGYCFAHCLYRDLKEVIGKNEVAGGSK